VVHFSAFRVWVYLGRRVWPRMLYYVALLYHISCLAKGIKAWPREGVTRRL